MKSPMRIDTISSSNAHGLLPADVADHLERLPLDEARQILLQLSPDRGASILAELDAENAAGLLETFTCDQIISRLQILSPNLVADLVLALPAKRRGEVLRALPPDLWTSVTVLGLATLAIWKSAL
jgi:Mg/Co/Ni transporter MgtE